jgi:heme A synthase
MLAVHRVLAIVIVLLALGGTIWAVHDWLGRGAVHPRLMTFTIAMSAVIGLQAVFGIILAVTGNRPVDGTTHFIVGPATLFVLPVARRVASTRSSDRAATAILAVAWFVLLLLTLRAVGSGGGINA